MIHTSFAIPALMSQISTQNQRISLVVLNGVPVILSSLCKPLHMLHFQNNSFQTGELLWTTFYMNCFSQLDLRQYNTWCLLLQLPFFFFQSAKMTVEVVIFSSLMFLRLKVILGRLKMSPQVRCPLNDNQLLLMTFFTFWSNIMKMSFLLMTSRSGATYTWLSSSSHNQKGNLCLCCCVCCKSLQY